MTFSALLEAVKEMGRTWGAQKRYMLTSKEQGWNPQSTIARFKEMKDGAGSGTHKLTQFTEEAHTGDGLLFARALSGAPYEINQIAWLHFVSLGKAKQKAHTLGVSTAEYWRRVGELQIWIAARVPTVETTVETRKSG